MSLENAASAFDADMGVASAPAAETNNRPVEQLFPDREIENDVIAGGDDLPNEGEVELDPIEELYVDPKPKKAKAKAEVDDEDEDDEDADADEDEDADEDDDEDDEDDKGEVYKVVVDGKEEEVSLRDALDGYIRRETFDRRMNKLGQAAKAMESQATLLMTDRQSVIDRLTSLEEDIKAIVPAEPNWDELFAADKSPGAEKTRKLQKDYEALRGKLDGLKSERTKQQEALAAEQDFQFQQYVKAEKAKTLENNPAWTGEKGAERQKKDLTAMAKTAADAGFSKEEIENVFDSRMITILLKASRLDRILARKTVPIQRGKKPVNSGAGRTRTAPKSSQRAADTLRKTGTVDAAASVFTQLISKKG